MDQSLPLFDAEQASIQARFEDFHARNPDVLERLARLAREWRSAGNRKCGIRMLWERLRWEIGMERQRDGEFMLNDHFHSRYARLLCSEYPELAGMFELRTLKAS
jgi:hypothetical protein